MTTSLPATTRVMGTGLAVATAMATTTADTEARINTAPTALGRFRIDGTLGRGGMAVVYLAHDTELGRPVAIKFLADHVAGDDGFRARFAREGRIAARLSHPNIVQVFDVGQEAGRPFIVMEYVAGESLGETLRREQRLAPQRVLEIGQQTCSGLGCAHAAGLVHRDVKPQNLILGRDGALRLSDFGIAVAHEGTQLTLVGTVLGTAGYLAPEQARGEQVTAAADLYALGAVLYELLAGEPTRRSGSLAELGADDGFRAPDVAKRVPGIPAELAVAVNACLSRRPEDRPSSAAALARMLAPVASEADTLSLPVDPAQRATEILALPSEQAPRRRMRRRLAALAALVVAAAAGLAVALVLNSSGNAPHRAQTQSGVAPPQTGSSVVEGAQNLAAWLRQHSG